MATHEVTKRLHTQVHTPRYAKYGLLYSRYTILDTRQLTPPGWRVFDDGDASVLDTFVGGVGGKLKEAGTTHWTTPNTGATNETGFTLLPGGMLRAYTGEFTGGFIEMNTMGIWFIGSASNFLCLYNSSDLESGWYSFLKDGFSVRLTRESNLGWTPGEKVVDYDGNIYDTVRIGTDSIWRIYTVQNFACTHYRNGESIPRVTDPNLWRDLTAGAYAVYNNDWSNVFV